MNRNTLDILFGLLAAWLLWKHVIRPKTLRLKAKIKDYGKHLQHMLNMNKDIYGDDLNKLISEEIEAAKALTKDKEKTKEELSKFLDESQKKIKDKLPQRKFEMLAENLDILLVAFSLAFAVRALFLQPFKIPTSSMQPTLHGVNTYDDSVKLDKFGGLTEAQFLREKHDRYLSISEYKKGGEFYKSNKLRAFLDSLYYGQQYADIKALPKGGGNVSVNAENGIAAHAISMAEMVAKTIGFPLLESYSKIKIGDKEYILPIPAHKLNSDHDKEVLPNRFVNPGDDIFSGVSEDGDHLFVNRIVYNFRNPQRGDISVFMTDKIRNKDQKLRGQFFIKRLVGMPNETIRIKNRKVYKVIDGKEIPLKKKDHEAFEKIYSEKDGYHGHFRAFEGENSQQPSLTVDGENIRIYDTKFVKTEEGYKVTVDSYNPNAKPLWKNHLPKIEKDRVILYSDYQEIYFYQSVDGRYYLTDIIRKDGYEAHFTEEYDEYKIGKNQYFMLGDNSNSSLDSRYWGPVPRQSLMGTASTVFWPFSHRWGFADNNDLKKIETIKPGKY